MAYDRFLIAPIEHGLRTDLVPFLTPEDSFTRLNNAYVFRGRLKKRFGSTLTGSGGTTTTKQLSSRLRIPLTGGAAVGITDGTGAATGTVPGAKFEIGQMFSIDEAIYTVYQTGTPAAMYISDGTTTATFDTTTGAYVFAGAPATKQVYFYTSEPVMGFRNYEQGAVNEHTSFAFDTQFAYKFSGSAWDRDGSTVWNSTNTDYFWSANWQGVTSDLISMFTTNFKASIGTPGASDDPIYSYDGSSWADFSALTKFNSDQDVVSTAKIIIPFKNRLLLLNTIENDISGPTNSAHVNRCRFSHNGSPFAGNAWLEPNTEYTTNTADGAGWIDAPTEEEIISAALIKDRLIVYFERSTWEIVYTGNEALPFVWQSINSSLGSEATFSTIAFDKNILTIGTTGIHSCNGANVTRIDEEIPDKVYEVLKTTEGTKKIHGIKDFYNEMVYWTFRKNAHADDNEFPDRVMVYNYQNGSWSFNDDCITTFGYFEQSSDMTWGEADFTWEETDATWDSFYQQANSRNIIAGNQQGFVFALDADMGQNSPAMQITNMTYSAPYATITSINHNLRDRDFIKLTNVAGFTGFTDGIYQVASRVDEDTITIRVDAFTGTYTGVGLIARVSRIEAETKDMNPYLKEGKNLYLAEVNFNVDKTSSGEITINYTTSSSNLDMIDESQDSNTILGNNVLETKPYTTVTLEASQQRLWHSTYFQAEGEFVKLKLSLSDEQMLDESVVESTFSLNAMILYTKRTGY